jgi:hypothetical protein
MPNLTQRRVMLAYDGEYTSKTRGVDSIRLHHSRKELEREDLEWPGPSWKSVPRMQ